jgi:hypothetical protein
MVIVALAISGWQTYVPVLAQLTATLISLTALFVSFRVERRNQRRFQQQLETALEVAKANVAPRLGLSAEAYWNRQAIILRNYGPGTAIITALMCHRGNHSSRDLGDLFAPSANVSFEEISGFSDGKNYAQGHSTEVILLLTLEALVKAGHEPADARRILEALETQIDEFSMTVTYEDVLHNEIETNLRLLPGGETEHT